MSGLRDMPSSTSPGRKTGSFSSRERLPAVAETRRPYYFGSRHELFGCLHEPRGGTVRDSAVVICQPIGEEYIRAHRALVQLAARLALAGIPVLRFDYMGCGDSAGDLRHASLRRWLDDIECAVEDVRRRCAASYVSLVGLRLGASLANLAAVERGSADTLVLWEPVVSGRDYLAEMQRRHKEMLRYAYVSSASGEGHAPLEVQGFELSPALYEDLERIDLLAVAAPAVRHVLIVERAASTANDSLRSHLETRTNQCEQRLVPHPEVWQGEANGGVVPHLVVESIVSALTRERR